MYSAPVLLPLSGGQDVRAKEAPTEGALNTGYHISMSLLQYGRSACHRNTGYWELGFHPSSKPEEYRPSGWGRGRMWCSLVGGKAE